MYRSKIETRIQAEPEKGLVQVRRSPKTLHSGFITASYCVL